MYETTAFSLLLSRYSHPCRGQDIFISTWNLHRSPAIWDRPEDFVPERWPLDGPDPTETTENYRSGSIMLGWLGWMQCFRTRNMLRRTSCLRSNSLA